MLDFSQIHLPDPSPLAIRFYHSGNLLWACWVLWSLLVPAAFLFTGASAALRRFCKQRTGVWFLALALYLALFKLFLFLCNVPLGFYTGFIRPHAYGLSNQDFWRWASDALKSLGIGTLLAVITLWLPYRLIERMPRRWWIATGLAAIPFSILAMVVAPIWIDPLFNRFGPMQDKGLEKAITQLAARAGVTSERIFQVDKSVDTKALNAYVVGLFGSKRIVLWDTLIRKLDRDEVLYVVAHELGHYVLHHVLIAVALFSLGIFCALYLIHLGADFLIRRYAQRFGFTQLSDFASFPLLLLLFQLSYYLISPIGLAISRHQEHEADRFALELTQNTGAALSAEVKMIQTNLDYPRPPRLVRWLRYTHPCSGERFDFAKSYRPWETGGELVYGGYFRGQRSWTKPSEFP